MKAVVYESFQQLPQLQNVADPSPTAYGAVIKVEATGVCRSDWHGWMGHDTDICLPHVPGHELAGVVAEVGSEVQRWRVGDRVTVPFIAGCGKCFECATGNHQVCGSQTQPGFTHWGSFAEYVAIDQVDTNLVMLPESIDFVTAASLGCRFATSFRAVVAQGRTLPGQWLVVHGCGGIGLSAVMIAQAIGAQVIAIDISDEKLKFARSIGADFTLNANQTDDLVMQIKSVSQGGAHVSLDALGSQTTCFNSIACLRPRGKHVQVGLLVGDEHHPSLPMELVLAKELEIIGSHGMQAHAYPQMMQMIAQRKISPELLVSQKISLHESIQALVQMDQFNSLGVTVVDRF